MDTKMKIHQFGAKKKGPDALIGALFGQVLGKFLAAYVFQVYLVSSDTFCGSFLASFFLASSFLGFTLIIK